MVIGEAVGILYSNKNDMLYFVKGFLNRGCDVTSRDAYQPKKNGKPRDNI